MNERSDPPLRILHVFGRMNRGGAELRTLDLMHAIDRDMYSFDFCVLSGRRGELDRDIEWYGGRVHYCKLDWSFPVKFFRLLRNENYDVVHSHVLYTSGLVLLHARLAGVNRRIAHFRTTGKTNATTFGRRLRMCLLRWLIDRSATNIVAVSRGAMDSAWGGEWASDPRCSIVYNMVPVDSFSTQPDPETVRCEFGWPRNAKMVIHIGRMDPSKNHLRLLEIFSKLLEVEPTATLLLVGRPSPAIRKQLEERIAVLGLSSQVHMADERRDVPRLLLASNLLLFPSLWEGLPGSVLEAAIAGVPTVASDLPGVCEIAEDFETVETLSLAESDERWVNSCVRQLSRRRNSSAVASYNRSRFSREAVVAQYLAVWGSRGSATRS